MGDETAAALARLASRVLVMSSPAAATVRVVSASRMQRSRSSEVPEASEPLEGKRRTVAAARCVLACTLARDQRRQ